MKKAGSIQKAAESLWEVREERGLMNLTGVGKPEFDEILHPAIIFFISERFGSMGCPQGMLAPVTESRPNYTQTVFCKVGGSMQKMSIYWEKHGSHNALIVGAGFHIFSCVEKGQELHNAMPFKG